ncbi:MAG: gliding motility lipoprotein GldH [Bacteroidaceae bacterium]|nr:gliding motility lipoprotein GldH [Bacteroidaceae bacterium]
MGDMISSFSRYKSLTWLICVLMMAVLFTQCSSETTYFHQYKSVDIDGWNSEDTIVFHITPASTNTVMNAEIGVRTTNAFIYNKLFLKGTLQCEGDDIVTDTLFVTIFDKKGVNLGDGLPYPLCTKAIPPIRMDSGKVYTYTITPLMQSSSVEGVKDVGLKLYFTDK